VPLVRFAPSPSHRFTPGFGVLGWILLSGGWLLAGCTAPLPVAKSNALPSARFVVINLTDYRWHIAVTRPPATVVADFQVEGRESRSIDIAGGEYTIKQTSLAMGAASGLDREIPAKFESGETYRWKLATLLSAEPAGTVSP